VICLSDYVAGNFKSVGIDVETSHFPHYQQVRNISYSKNKGQICFVGRGYDYKDLHVIELLAASDDFRDCRILVAGNLADLVTPNMQSSRLILMPGWLSLSQLEEIIAESEAMVLPYKSASQSGLVDIAEAFSTKVIATPVGGLIEQVGNTSNGFIAKSADPLDIAFAIKLALSSSINKKSVTASPSRTVTDSVIQISQRSA